MSSAYPVDNENAVQTVYPCSLFWTFTVLFQHHWLLKNVPSSSQGPDRTVRIHSPTRSFAIHSRLKGSHLCLLVRNYIIYIQIDDNLLYEPHRQYTYLRIYEPGEDSD